MSPLISAVQVFVMKYGGFRGDAEYAIGAATEDVGH